MTHFEFAKSILNSLLINRILSHKKKKKWLDRGLKFNLSD